VEVLFEAGGDFGVGSDDVGFFGGVGDDVEEFPAGGFVGVEDELVATVEDGAGAGVVGGENCVVPEIEEVARGGAVGAEFHERGRACWSSGSR